MNLSKFLTFLVLVLLLATFSLQLFGLMTINTIEIGKNETVKGEIDKVCVKKGKTNYYPCALRYIFSFGNEATSNTTEIEIDEYEMDEEENYLEKSRERKVLIFSLFYFTWTFLLMAFFCILSKFFYNHKHNFINIVSGSLIAISVSSSFIIMLINGFANYQDSICNRISFPDDSESPLLYQTGFLALYASLFTSFFSSIFSCFNQSWLMALKRNDKAINTTIPHLSKAK